ncbi:TIR domain-containing protein [bacterium]|nr:TIR domain-containing protein [bacterium]
MADAFISYKRSERAIVERLRDRLSELKVDVWFDARLEAGESFNQEITREARAAKAILVCWSPEAAKSDWVQAEALIGLEEGKLVAANVVAMNLSSLPIPFNSKHTVDLTGWVSGQSEEGWREVVSRLAVLVRRPGLRDFVRLPDPASVSAPERLKALSAWAAANGDDPLAEQVWHEIETLETEEQKRKVAERKAKAAAEAAARAPKEASPVEREAQRDAAQGRAWRALGDRPTTEKLRAFVKEWKSGPLVELARRELKDRAGGAGAGGGRARLGGLLGAVGAIGVVAVIAAAVWFSGVLRPDVDPADRAAWQIAQDLNVEAAYTAYLENYPTGAFVGDANAALSRFADDRRKVADAESAAAAWQQATDAGTVAAYEQFLAAWPASDYADDARSELQRLNKAADDSAWNDAKAANAVASYRKYLADQPNGAYRTEAEASITALEAEARTKAETETADRAAWAAAQRTNTAAGYASYLRAYPSGLFARQARAAGDRLTTEAEDQQAADQIAQAKALVARFTSSVDAGDRDCSQSFVTYHEWDRSDLTSQAAAVIDQSVARATAGGCAIKGALVVGHDDTSQSRLYSYKLAERRAASVRAALTARGVADGVITAVSYGEAEPAKATRDGVREPLNRRVEIRLVASRAAGGAAAAQPTAAPSSRLSAAELSRLVDSGNAAELRGDYAAAPRDYGAACDGGQARGCLHLGVLFKNGLGVAQDYGTARELFQKACDGGEASGCFSLGGLYANGQGVAQDYGRARALYQKACDGGHTGSCSNLKAIEGR